MIMKQHLFPAIKLTFFTVLLFAVAYPLVLWGIAQWAPNHGEGIVVEYRGKKYYDNIGQRFTGEGYFHSRPSAVEYDAAGSGGSNKSASNPQYLALVQARIDAFLVDNPGVHRQEIPVDLLTASGSGLDPHISPEAAQVQVKRIARARGIPENDLRSLVASHTEKPLWGMFGPPKVHVLRLNIALDSIR